MQLPHRGLVSGGTSCIVLTTSDTRYTTTPSPPPPPNPFHLPPPLMQNHLAAAVTNNKKRQRPLRAVESATNPNIPVSLTPETEMPRLYLCPQHFPFTASQHQQRIFTVFPVTVHTAPRRQHIGGEGRGGGEDATRVRTTEATSKQPYKDNCGRLLGCTVCITGKS